jgi:teichuronic acid biosynthesis glycosyltransferase TuaG
LPKSNDKISVIIPTFNREETLTLAIRSALEQTYPVLEVLVCDDGSTDNSEKIVKSFNDPKVKWIPGQHFGRPAIPRNRGIKLSTGDWIAFLDSDDSWNAEKIEKQLQISIENNLSAVCSNAIRLMDGLENQLYLNKVSKIINFDDLVLENKIICSSALIHRSIIKKIGFFPEESNFRAIEDYSYWLKAATYTNWGYSRDGLVNYKDDPENSIRSEGRSEKEQKFTILEGYLEWNNNQNSKEFITVKKAVSKLSEENHFSFLIKLKQLFS